MRVHANVWACLRLIVVLHFGECGLHFAFVELIFSTVLLLHLLNSLLQLREEYTGDWRAGVRSGDGRCVYADGRVYEGSWDSDLAHGNGTITFPNGEIVYCANVFV